MATTIGVQLTLFAGTSTDMTIELVGNLLGGGTLLNTGGDELTEVGNGYFTAEIAETLSGPYSVIVKSDGVAVFDSYLAAGATVVGIGPALGNLPTAEQNANATASKLDETGVKIKQAEKAVR